MAFHDIMPHKFSSQPLVQYYPVDAAMAAVVGEPVVLNGAGEIQECSDPLEAPGDIIGILATTANISTSDVPSATLIQTTKTYPTTAAGGFVVAADPAAVTMFDTNTAFITDNFDTVGAPTAAVPTLANALGEPVGLLRDASSPAVWYVSTSTNTAGRIVDVLDAQKESLITGTNPGAGVYVVVIFTTHQLTSATAPSLPVA
jgi:hypothetical protein